MCGYSTVVPAEVITIASLKGGVGKTTSSYALCAAAAAGGLKVIAIDLDPTGGLSNALERAKRRVTVIDVPPARSPDRSPPGNPNRGVTSEPQRRVAIQGAAR